MREWVRAFRLFGLSLSMAIQHISTKSVSLRWGMAGANAHYNPLVRGRIAFGLLGERLRILGGFKTFELVRPKGSNLVFGPGIGDLADLADRITLVNGLEMNTPALLTSVSTRPNFPTASPITRSATAGSVMSPATASTSTDASGLMDRELATTR